MANSTKRIVRAIDLGFGFVKMIEGIGSKGEYITNVFPSIAARATKKNLGSGHFAERDTVTVEHNGVSYEVGKDAALAMNSYGGRALDNNYTHSDAYSALMKGALMMMQLNQIDLLVLGAPVKNFDTTSAHLKKTWTGNIQLNNVRKIKINNVSVIPQPVGGLAWYGSETNTYEKLREQRNLIIDPGHFTLDWLICNGMKMTSDSNSFEGGMAFVIRAIAADMGIDESNQVTLNNIDEYLYNGKPFVFNGKKYDLSKHMAIANATIRDSIAEMAAKLRNTVQDVENIILLGGAANIYKDEISKRYPTHQIKIVKDNNLANVKGFQWIGEKLVKG